MITYNEKKHCINCTLGKCQLNYHIRSGKYKSTGGNFPFFRENDYMDDILTYDMPSHYEYDSDIYRPSSPCKRPRKMLQVDSSSKSKEVEKIFQVEENFDSIYKLLGEPNFMKYSLNIFECDKDL